MKKRETSKAGAIHRLYDPNISTDIQAIGDNEADKATTLFL